MYFDRRFRICVSSELLPAISTRVDRVSATETIVSGLIRGEVKPKTITIGIHSLPA